MRPRDIDIPEIFQRFYAHENPELMKKWCADFLHEEVEICLSPLRQDFINEATISSVENFFVLNTGSWKFEGLANSGDLLMTYGNFRSYKGVFFRFAHIWWLSGKRVLRFEEMLS